MKKAMEEYEEMLESEGPTQATIKFYKNRWKQIVIPVCVAATLIILGVFRNIAPHVTIARLLIVSLVMLALNKLYKRYQNGRS